MSEKKKRNIIIGLLCSVVLLMIVGYAAFSSVLKIKGTSNISSNWDVRITDIQEGEKTGMASTSLYKEGDKAGQKIMEYEDLTATFSADLQSPGDFIEYKITVSNQGTLNAKLNKITISDPDNEYISFETSGLVEGMVLKENDYKILTVKVIYKNITEGQGQPTNRVGTIKVTLDFSQANVDENGIAIPTSQTVYRYTNNRLYPGDKIAGIETTTDPSSLEKNIFLKHIITNGLIESSELCFIKNGQMYSLNPYEYERTKTTLLNIFGESECDVTDSKIECDDVSLYLIAHSTGYINAMGGSIGCTVSYYGELDSSCS